MIPAQIDDTFFKLLDHPEAWGLIGLFLIAFIFDRYLGYRFYKQAIHREQSDQDADNERQRDLINLIGGTLNDIKTALDNNTEAFKQFALSHLNLEKKISDTNEKLESKITKSNSELREIVERVLLAIEDINKVLSEMKGNNSRGSEELRLLLNKAEKIIQELSDGNSKDSDTTTAG